MPAPIEKTKLGFSVSGSVTFDNVVTLSRQGCEQISKFKEDKIVVDLADMQEKNAAGLALLLTWVRAAKQQKILLSFVHLSASLQSMVNTFGLTEVLKG